MFSKDLREAAEVGSSTNVVGNYELHDLVQLEYVFGPRAFLGTVINYSTFTIACRRSESSSKQSAIPSVS